MKQHSQEVLVQRTVLLVGYITELIFSNIILTRTKRRSKIDRHARISSDRASHFQAWHVHAVECFRSKKRATRIPDATFQCTCPVDCPLPTLPPSAFRLPHLPVHAQPVSLSRIRNTMGCAVPPTRLTLCAGGRSTGYGKRWLRWPGGSHALSSASSHLSYIFIDPHALPRLPFYSSPAIPPLDHAQSNMSPALLCATPPLVESLPCLSRLSSSSSSCRCLFLSA